MARNRKGVTLFEIMTVIVLSAIMLTVAIPRITRSKRSASMQSARTQVESYISVARAIAVRNGGKTQLIRSGNMLYVQADTGTGWVTVVRPVELDQVSGVSLGTTITSNTIAFDARGMATNLSASGEKFYITSTTYGTTLKDSICVTRFGALLDRNCGLSVVATTTGGTTTGGTTTGGTTTGGTTVGGVVGGVVGTVGGILP